MPGSDQKRNEYATRVAFFIDGLGFSTLAPFVPTIKQKLGLDEGTLGLLLLCVGLGSMLVMPFGGGLAARLSCRKVILASAIVMGCSLPLIVLAPDKPMLAIALLLLGAGGGTLDVAMNVQAVDVERASGRPMMSGFHGMFSVGGVVGAGSISGMFALNWSPLICQTVITFTFFALLLTSIRGHLTATHDPELDHKPPIFSIPKGKVILLGLMCLIIFMSEGSVADWSGVLLTGYRHAEKAQAGLGYVAFSAMMTLNRLLGDRIVQKLGRPIILVGGTIVGAIGLFLAAFVPLWQASIVGFALVGIGLANVVPILFNSTGTQTDMPEGPALSAVSTMGYIGLLTGPAVLGFIAKKTSLEVSFALLAILCILVATLSGQVLPKTKHDSSDQAS